MDDGAGKNKLPSGKEHQAQKQTHTQEKAAQEALQMIAENMDHSMKSIRTSTHPYAK